MKKKRTNVKTYGRGNYNYLKHIGRVLKLVQQKYNIDRKDLIFVLLYLNDMPMFLQNDFRDASLHCRWNSLKLKRLIIDGYIVKIESDRPKRLALYRLTFKAKRIVKSVYEELKHHFETLRDIGALSYKDKVNFKKSDFYVKNDHTNFLKEFGLLFLLTCRKYELTYYELFKVIYFDTLKTISSTQVENKKYHISIERMNLYDMTKRGVLKETGIGQYRVSRPYSRMVSHLYSMLLYRYEYRIKKRSLLYKNRPEISGKRMEAQLERFNERVAKHQRKNEMV